MTDIRDKNLGQVFTNEYIVDLILDEVKYNSINILGKYILEPSTGNGAFLQKIVKRIIKYSPIKDLEYNLSFVYGWELDTDVYNECIDNLNKLIEPFNLTIKWNIINTNSIFKINELSTLFKSKSIKFDFIVGNPPYLLKKNIDKNTQKFINNNYITCKGNYDLYYAFFELGWKFLKDNGVCAYITPNTYFYNISGKDLREFFVGRLEKIIDYKENIVFKNVSTYTCITIFRKNKRIFDIKYQYNYEKNNIQLYKEKIINFKTLKNGNVTGWNFDNDNNNDENIKGISIKNLTKTFRGLSSRNDKVFILKSKQLTDNSSTVTNRYNEVFEIETSILKRIIKISREKAITGKTREYVIFPYLLLNNDYFIYEENSFQNKYPLAYAYLSKYRIELETRNYKNWYSLDDGYVNNMTKMRGDLLLFSPIMDVPKFYHIQNTKDFIFYSGHIIKGTNSVIKNIINFLNLDSTWDKIYPRFNKIRGGWYRVKISIIQNLKIDI